MCALSYIWAINQADVAQLDRAFGYEPKGSRFESWHPQKKMLRQREASFFSLEQTDPCENRRRRNRFSHVALSRVIFPFLFTPILIYPDGSPIR